MMSRTMGTRGGRNPVRVGNLLTQAVPALAERLLEEAIRREWPQTIGPDAARRSRPLALRHGVLDISVDNSPWLQELTLRSAAIAAALQKQYGSKVSSVRFVLAAKAPSPVAPESNHPRPNVSSRQLSAEEARQVDDAARRLADHGFATSFKRLLTKDLLARGDRRASAAAEQS